MEALPWVAGASSVGAIVVILLIASFEFNVEYKKVKQDHIERWLADRLKNATRAVDLVWSPDAIPPLETFIEQLAEKSEEIPIRIVVGPDDATLDTVRHIFDAASNGNGHNGVGLQGKIVDAHPSQEFIVFDDSAVLWFEAFAFENPEDRYYSSTKNNPRAATKLRGGFEHKWSYLFNG